MRLEDVKTNEDLYRWRFDHFLEEFDLKKLSFEGTTELLLLLGQICVEDVCVAFPRTIDNWPWAISDLHVDRLIEIALDELDATFPWNDTPRNVIEFLIRGIWLLSAERAVDPVELFDRFEELQEAANTFDVRATEHWRHVDIGHGRFCE